MKDPLKAVLDGLAEEAERKWGITLFGDGYQPPRGIPALAMLVRKEFPHYRAVCLGCTERLHIMGMVKLVKEMPISERQPEYSTLIYEIADGFTLAECQEAVPEHVGPPAWGE